MLRSLVGSEMCIRDRFYRTTDTDILPAMSVDTRSYYAEYHGHPTVQLQTILEHVRGEEKKSVVFLAGDSSLDNKYWFDNRAAACNGYEGLLRPALMKQDVCYWMNYEAEARGEPVCCLNTAIEATSLNTRAFCCMPEQDEFIRDNIGEDDILVVSVGGNDIALAPVLCTCFNMGLMMCCNLECCIEHCAVACPPNLYTVMTDPGCALCGLPGFVSGSLCGWPLGFGYFVDLFKNRVQHYVSRLVSKTKPKKVVICMIYYLEETGAQRSWADPALFCLGYTCWPSKLQTAIRKVYEKGTSAIKIDGVEVVPFALYTVLDGKDPTDYLQRVEPSPTGGHKIAKALLDLVLDADD
eukprot:TRINITY_DN61165_c0_g1_i2.p1 TRINITY_DN61165_c0_g1~~TRINITY_DN61165_c0_g1_i2.p1  ORF type:complete len:353 (+),score=74.00 TRINITY_DN61165_c0_g1_i2:123-1181(+)